MINADDVASLRQALRGNVFVPTDVSFRSSVVIDNGRIDRQPAVIALPRSVQDVACALRFAREHKLPFTVKGGGHSYSGYCLNADGLVLDLSLMKTMTLNADAQTLSVQMGAIWSDVYRYLQEYGTELIPVGGACDSVGLPGFLLGGGYSFMSRSYGLACDSLISLEIVTPDATIRSISPNSQDSDERGLFWACQGGGGGNFGVVVGATLKLHRPNTSKMLAGVITYPFDQLEAIMDFYNDWAPSLPNELAVYGFIGNIPHPASGRPMRILRLQPLFNGEFATGLELVRPLLRFNPVFTTLYNVTLPEYIAVAGKITEIEGRLAYTRSGVMGAFSLKPEVVKVFQRHLLNAPSKDSFLLWMHQGGKANDFHANATAYPHRDAAYIFEIAAIWKADADTRTNVEWAFQFGQELEPHFSGAFINYIDPLLPGWSSKYYKQNYERLLEMKARWDPDGVFTFQQGIGSSFDPSPVFPLDLSPLSRTHISPGGVT